MTHATHLATLGLRYLGDLQLNDLYQLRDELDTLWTKGQSTVSNTLYDKVVDSINYESSQLNGDPYNYAIKREDAELKKLLDYFTLSHSQGKPMVENAVWDILNREVALRSGMISPSSITFPSHWTAMSLDELPVQFIQLSRSSNEFRDLSAYFTKSLGQASTVIYSITRLQNRRLWARFQELQKTIPHNTQRLIHGTASPAHQKLVVYHGFSHSFCPGGSIGDGVYFAVNAHYSNADPYVLKRTPHRRELFICQVLLGDSSQGQYGVRSIPISSGIHSLYHLADQKQNGEFCIFNPYQAYPEYLVQYDY